MTAFQEKTIRLLGKTENSSSIEILTPLLDNADSSLRELAFDALFLKKLPEVNVILFEHFAKNEDRWAGSRVVSTERLSRLADAAFRSDSPAIREEASRIILKYKLYETLPIIVIYLEGSSQALASKARQMLLELAESFYKDLADCPPLERRNLDRRREWFVQQLDGPIKRYAVHEIDELLKALLVITGKGYDTMRMVVSDHRSAACKRISEMLLHDNHPSYIRLLLSYLGDGGSPPVIDEILATRSDEFFVRKLLETVGPAPSMEFREALKRFQEFAWFYSTNPELPGLVDGLEPCAVQLLQSASMPKSRKVKLFRFFLQRPAVESRRAASEAIRRLVGEEINKMLLEFVNDPDPVTSATVFRILKSRNVKEIDDILPQLVERPEEDIRKAIYDMMPELHVESFASQINQMTPATAKTIGHYVRLIDPNTVKIITDDIHSPIPIRRLAACKGVEATGLAGDFAERLIEIAETDDESHVRCAAIRALSSVMTKPAIDTIRILLNDHSMDIRDAATSALKVWMTAYQAMNPPTPS